LSLFHKQPETRALYVALGLAPGRRGRIGAHDSAPGKIETLTAQQDVDAYAVHLEQILSRLDRLPAHLRLEIYASHHEKMIMLAADRCQQQRR